MNPFYRNHTQQAQQNPFNLQAALQSVASRIPFGMTPEQFVRQKIQNREISQQQFEQYAQIADMVLGRRR